MPAKKTTSTEPVVAAAPAPVEEKKVKKTKTTVKTETVETAPVVVTEAAATVAAVDTTETTLVDQSVEFVAKLQQLGALIASLKSEYKKWTSEVKTAQKQSSKRKRKAGNRAPSGFVKPTKISDELASFLGKEKGSEMARTDVTREINTYIRAHKLQDEKNGRKINPDTKLASLLKLKKTDELTYFNLQKYMSPHFAKAVKVETTTA